MTRIREAQLLVLAKSPVQGRVKTRLCPPYTSREAARIAAAALADTLDSVAACPVQSRVLALDGPITPLMPQVSTAFHLIAQIGGGLGERIENAFAAAWRTSRDAVLLIGMDTPQVDAAALTAAIDALLEPSVDAVLGLAEDGGFWALGLRRPVTSFTSGVAMSTGRTGIDQLTRLQGNGLRVHLLPTRRDVDVAADAAAVAVEAPFSRFASVCADVKLERAVV